MQSLGTGCCGGVFDRDLLKIKNKILKKKRGLGDCPQGVVFEFKQKSFHVSVFDFVFSGAV